MLSVTYTECPIRAIYAECHEAECHYVECRYAECRGAVTNTVTYYSVELITS
jgi:hypothetical protein